MSDYAYPTNRLVYDYGDAVRRREACADGMGDFDGWNKACLNYWREMKKRGCYRNLEGSLLHEQWRPYYYAGLNGEKMPSD